MGDFTFGSSEAIAALALMASVISLAVSWHLGRHSARTTTYRSATDLTLDIDRIFVEHPGLRKYFYGHQDLEAEDDDTKARIEAVAELMLDCFECIWDIRHTYSPVDRGSWGHYVVDVLDGSPVLARMFDERRGDGWYPALDDLMLAKEKNTLQAPSVRVARFLRRFWRESVP